MLQWSLTELRALEGTHSFQVTVSLDDLIPLRDNVERIEPVCVSGIIEKRADDSFYLKASIVGNAQLFCARTLDTIPYPFTIALEGNIAEGPESDAVSFAIENDHFDLKAYVRMYVDIELPTRIIKENGTWRIPKSGKGWRYMEEEENKPFANLSAHLDEQQQNKK